MKDIEDALNDAGKEFDRMKAPEEFEQRLRSALAAKRKPRFRINRAVAAVLVAALLLTYSFDTIAYYGKKLMGYEGVVYGSIKELNDEGRGQEIGKSVRFSNGLEVTLDGIMFDDNQLVAFYKLKNDKEPVEGTNLMMHIKGLKPMGYNQSSGTGRILEDGSEVWVMQFDPPAFFEKWLSLDINMLGDGKNETASISFTLDRSKAMKSTAEQDINKKISIGDVDISFNKISASPMTTVIDGVITPRSDAAWEEFRSKRPGFSQPSLEFDLVENGVIPRQGLGGSMGSALNGYKFSSEFDAIDGSAEGIEIKNIKLVRRKYIDKTAELSTRTADLRVDDDIVVKSVRTEGKETVITIHSSGSPVMGLFIDGKQMLPASSPYSDGKRYLSGSAAIDQIYRYQGIGDDMELSFKLIEYAEYSDKTVYIPID